MATDFRTTEAWRGLVTLAEIDRAESRLPKEQIEALTVSAPDKSPAGSSISTTGGSRSMARRRTRARSPPIRSILRQGRTQRAMPLRLGQEVQEVLRAQLTGR